MNNKTAIIQRWLMSQGYNLGRWGVDGVWGAATQKAFADYNEQLWWWPAYESLDKVFGRPDLVSKTHPNIVYVKPPYPMQIAWQPQTKVTRIAIHEKVKKTFECILQDILDFYGLDGIEKHGLDQFGGTLNVRKMRGGDKLSTHAYGIAIDIDPVRNQWKWNSKQAYIPQHCPELIDIFRAYGWESLGDKKGWDYMHFQACRL